LALALITATVALPVEFLVTFAETLADDALAVRVTFADLLAEETFAAVALADTTVLVTFAVMFAPADTASFFTATLALPSGS